MVVFVGKERPEKVGGPKKKKKKKAKRKGRTVVVNH